MSTPERRVTKDQTIKQLREAGLDPAVSLSTPNPKNMKLLEAERGRYERVWASGDPSLGYCPTNNARAFLRACEAALSEGSDLLSCEDDIDLAPDFPWFLALARQETAHVYFYAHDYRTRLDRRYGKDLWARLQDHADRGMPFPKGLYPMNDRLRINSGQCHYIPYSVLRRLPVKELEESRLASDTWVQHRMKDLRTPVKVALPHPVQHRAVRTGRDAHPRPWKGQQSMSFPLR